MAWVACALLLLASVAWAALLRGVRAPGWSVAGGIVAGLLLGPGIFGRALPDAHESLFVGGRAEREAVAALVGRQGADRVVARHLAPGSEAAAGLTEAQREALDAARRELRDARWTHQRPLRVFAGLAVTVMLLGGAAFQVGGPGAPRAAAAAGVSIGAWAAAFPGALAFFGLRLLADATLAEAALAGAAVAIGPWALGAVDRDAAERAEIGGARTIQAAGRVATLLALPVAGWAMWRARGGTGLLWAAPLAATVLSWVLPPPRQARLAQGLREVLLLAAVPAVAAAAAVRTDVTAHFALGPVVAFLLLSGDGRWLGALTGALVLGGRRGLRTMRLVLGSMAAGPTQLAVTAVAVHAAALSPPLVLSLLLGALLVEVTAPARRGMARRLTQTEMELDELQGPPE